MGRTIHMKADVTESVKIAKCIFSTLKCFLVSLNLVTNNTYFLDSKKGFVSAQKLKEIHKTYKLLYAQSKQEELRGELQESENKQTKIGWVNDKQEDVGKRQGLN